MTRPPVWFEKTLGPRTQLPLHAHGYANASLVLSGMFEETFSGRRSRCPQLTVLYKPAGIARGSLGRGLRSRDARVAGSDTGSRAGR